MKLTYLILNDTGGRRHLINPAHIVELYGKLDGNVITVVTKASTFNCELENGATVTEALDGFKQYF